MSLVLDQAVNKSLTLIDAHWQAVNLFIAWERNTGVSPFGDGWSDPKASYIRLKSIEWLGVILYCTRHWAASTQIDLPDMVDTITGRGGIIPTRDDPYSQFVAESLRVPGDTPRAIRLYTAECAEWAGK